MRLLANALTSIPFYIDDNIILSQLAQLNRKTVTIYDSLYLANLSNINGSLEGWFALPRTSPHPVPFLYSLYNLVVKRWPIGDDAYAEGIFMKPNFYEIRPGTLRVFSTDVDVKISLIQQGNRPFGGIVPISVDGFSFDNGVSELSQIRIGNSPYNSIYIAMGLLGGMATTDTAPFVAGGGLGMAIFHDCQPLYPPNVNPANPIPATFTSAAIDIGQYASGSWTTLETLGAVTYDIVPVGAMTRQDYHDFHVSLDAPNFNLISSEELYHESPIADQMRIPAGITKSMFGCAYLRSQ